MKKAFTIAETVVALSVLGVIAVVVLPMLGDIQPNKDKATYSKALNSLQGAISNVLEDEFSIATNASTSNRTFSRDRFLGNLTGEEFCSSLANHFNIKGGVNCGLSSFDKPNFVTTDGIKYWGLERKTMGEATDSFEIFTDRNELNAPDWDKRIKDSSGGKGDRKEGDFGLKISVRNDGKVFTPNTDAYAYENFIIEKSMSMHLKKD